LRDHLFDSCVHKYQAPAKASPWYSGYGGILLGAIASPDWTVVIWKIIRTNNILEALLLVFGLKFLTSLKKERLELMLAWIFLSLSCDLICDYFARRAWYNNHIINLFHLVSALLCFILFFKILQLRGKLARVYIAVTFLLIVACLIEFYLNRTPTIRNNVLTTVIFFTGKIILCGLCLAKVIDNPRTGKLQYEPLFWLFTGFLLNGIVHMVYYSFHRYFVVHIDDFKHYLFFPKLLIITSTFLAVCIFIAFTLCARKYALDRAATSTSHRAK
jgi:hypothetical protein